MASMGETCAEMGYHCYWPAWSEQPHFWRDGSSNEVPFGFPGVGNTVAGPLSEGPRLRSVLASEDVPSAGVLQETICQK